LRVGECLFLLDRTEDGRWYLVQGEDAYIAWVRSDAVLAVDGGTFDAWRSRARARVLRDVLIEGFRIPSGARLPIVEERPECAGVVVELPSLKPGVPGARVLLGEGHAMAEDSRGLGELVTQVAMGFLGTPYVWGGRSALGIDCSGFAETCWSVAGVMLPRDAFQQALVGRLVATCWHRTGMRPGDLLFFIDEGGRTFHVGISLGGQRFVHSSPPEVHVISLDPADPLYRQRWVDAFLFARRPLD
jgi:hypothetical protein